MIECGRCTAWVRGRRHPSEHTGECRMGLPRGVTETLGAKMEFRGKWPVTFADEGCMFGEESGLRTRRVFPTLREVGRV
jgi:hypothetical protein